MISLNQALINMENRANLIENLVRLEQPNLLDIFQMYENEARFARQFLDSNLKSLDADADILEVGGGILSLAVQLASEGFNVTTVEPFEEGFSSIKEIAYMYLNLSKKQNIELNFSQSPIESFMPSSRFDFIFAINVMEHLKEPFIVQESLASYLKTNGIFRFYSPNYDFPYEPHFKKFMISRRNESFFLPKSRIAKNLTTDKGATALYNSINFISLRKVELRAKKCNLIVNVNANIVYDSYKRFIHDNEIRNRHKLFYLIVKSISFFHLTSLLRFYPVRYAPVMDVKIQNNN
jgi:2-polyprenyl-3-methyl-5-hydroxy-6-metoxy-1,4-benzoquinol methylase